ncbi:hypothetical protein B0H12DRAFT_301260 [Mycena haematopus]|nr:hypothetical protein B0H12DRAFT_301260 [Mycena haematopus]
MCLLLCCCPVFLSSASLLPLCLYCAHDENNTYIPPFYTCIRIIFAHTHRSDQPAIILIYISSFWYSSFRRPHSLVGRLPATPSCCTPPVVARTLHRSSRHYAPHHAPLSHASTHTHSSTLIHSLESHPPTHSFPPTHSLTHAYAQYLYIDGPPAPTLITNVPVKPSFSSAVHL